MSAREGGRTLARIAIAGVPYAADKLYTYLAPDTLALRAGVRVTVPFGGGNRRREGFVMEMAGAGEEGTSRWKPVLEALDPEPLLDEADLRLVRWMKARYFCTFYDALKTILPAGIWFRYRDIYRIDGAWDTESACAAVLPGSPEETLLRALGALGEADLPALRKAAGAEAETTLAALLERGLVRKEATPVRKVTDRSLRMARLAADAEDALAAVTRRRASAPVRYEVIRLLAQEDTVAVPDLCYYTGATNKTLKSLERDGLITFVEREALRVPSYAESGSAAPVQLNEEQQAAFDGLNALMSGGAASVALLHGVTASGKTQVYIRLIQEVLARGRTALLLVPEIALTPQMMARFAAYFGNQAAMLHSGLRLTERYDQWKRIRRGEVRVVLGTRSAAFAPLRDLGLIVMDEEQESSYQSEDAPRYHAREIAQFLCARDGALLLLGSATPTVETSYYARNGRYQVFSLHRRYHSASLPEVMISDMREELRAGNDGSLGAALRAELAENLERGEQSILFLNRRGNARMLLCGACGTVPECPRCSVPLTYHSANQRLMCHYCGHSEPVYTQCRACGSPMKRIGAGTQKVEAELAAAFPGTEVLRMDADTVGATHGHEKLLRRFEREKVPILLGTQMVAKGLDFENVTLVGVLAADLSLYAENYHAPERTFSLLAQVVGRAGRGEKRGRAVIQTFTPENEVIRAAAAQDYEAFYQSEIRMRKLRRYPPFADLFTLTVSGLEEDRVLRACLLLRDALRGAGLPPDWEILGPASAPVLKVNNRYRYRVYIVGRNDPALRRLIADFLVAFHRRPENRALALSAACNALQ